MQALHSQGFGVLHLPIREEADIDLPPPEAFAGDGDFLAGEEVEHVVFPQGLWFAFRLGPVVHGSQPASFDGAVGDDGDGVFELCPVGMVGFGWSGGRSIFVGGDGARGGGGDGDVRVGGPV